MASRRVQRAKQVLKQVPGVGPARRRALAAVRGSTGLRELVRRLYHVDSRVPTPTDIAPGTLLQGVGTEALPVVLVLVLGADEESFTSTVDEVARLQRVTAGFRPVLVTDHPGLGAARRWGYPLELLVAESGWDPDVQGQSWTEYARARIALLLAAYRATVTVTAGPGGLDGPARLLLSALQAAAPVTGSEETTTGEDPSSRDGHG